jgi:hypothetical protein
MEKARKTNVLKIRKIPERTIALLAALHSFFVVVVAFHPSSLPSTTSTSTSLHRHRSL